MTNPHPRYLAYMLRLWQAGSDDDPDGWRVSLESPHTAERQGFTNLAQLFAFLEEKTSGSAGPLPEVTPKGFENL